jgi:exonuclease SbcC
MSGNLILRLVEVENFMGHERERLEFGPGVVLLAGASGNGKSSLITDAPGFALFDWRATRQGGQANGKKEKLRNRRARTKEFRVKVAFERSDGLTFEVERGLNDAGKPYVRSQDNHGGYGEGNSEVRQHLISLIGFMDADTYRRSFVTEQQSHEVLTDMKPAPRKEFVNKMLGIDIFSDIVKDVRSSAKEHTKRMRELQELLGGQSLDDAKRQMSEHDKLVETCRKRQQELEKKIAQAHASAQAAEKRLQEVTPQLERRRQVEARQQDVSRQLARIDGQLAADNPTERARYTQLVEGKAGLVARGKALAAQVEQMQAQAQKAQAARQLESQIESSLQRVERLAAELGDEPKVEDVSQLTASIEKLDEARVRLMSEQADIERRKRTVEEGTCSTCGRDYEPGEAHEHEAELNARLKEIEKSLAQVQTELAQAQQRLESSRAKAQELAVWSQRSKALQAAQTEHQQLQQKLTQMGDVAYDEAAHEAAKEQLTELRVVRDQTKSAAAWLAANPDPAQLRSQREQLAEQQQKLAGELEGLPARELGEQIVNEERELRRAESELRSQLAAAVSELGIAQRQMAALESRMATLASASDEARELRRKVADANVLAELTEAFWQKLSDEIRPQLSDIASDIMSRISHGTHNRVELTSEYDIVVFEDDGSSYDAYELSGGEKDRINFAMHVALTRLITHRTGTPIGYLILDEIFSGQDEGHIEQMVDILESLKAHYPQMFLISHANLEDYEFVNYKFDVSERKGKNRIRVYGR